MILFAFIIECGNMANTTMTTKLTLVKTLLSYEERQAWMKQQLDISKAEKTHALATIAHKHKVKVASVGKTTMIHSLSTVEDCEAFWPGISLGDTNDSKDSREEKRDA